LSYQKEKKTNSVEEIIIDDKGNSVGILKILIYDGKLRYSDN
jgi:hypothetical protein